jgi:hypothetical protein
MTKTHDLNSCSFSWSRSKYLEAESMGQHDYEGTSQPAHKRGGDAPVRSSFLLVTFLLFHLISF